MMLLQISFGAAVVGIALFWFVLPQTALWLTKVVQNSVRMDDFQKLRIINALETVHSGPAQNGVKNGSQFLMVSFFVLLAIQHYLLYIGNGSSAQIIVIGMFVLLAVHVASE